MAFRAPCSGFQPPLVDFGLTRFPHQPLLNSKVNTIRMNILCYAITCKCPISVKLCQQKRPLDVIILIYERKLRLYSITHYASNVRYHAYSSNKPALVGLCIWTYMQSWCADLFLQYVGPLDIIYNRTKLSSLVWQKVRKVIPLASDQWSHI